jgi:pimeloyl-ACP methyl ester carboxylesterase
MTYRLSSIRYTHVAILVMVVLSLACRAPISPDFDKRFSAWWINPDRNSTKALLTSEFSAAQIDSVVRVIRIGATRGTGSSILRDTLNNSYTLGFQTPRSFTPDSLYPLIVYLHGGIGTQRTDKGEKAFEMLAPLADSMSLFLASPSANGQTPWWSPAGLQRILQTVRFMTLYYPIDRDRIILAGVSDGATGCYAAANAIPGPFAGFIAVSGFGGMLAQLGIQLEPRNLAQRPIYNVNAGLDHLYPSQVVNPFLDWLAHNGVTVKRSFYPDQKHGFDYRMREMATLKSLVVTWRRPHTRRIDWVAAAGVPNRADNILGWDAAVRSRFSAQWRSDTLAVRPGAPQRFSILLEAPDAAPIWIHNAGAKPYRQKPAAVTRDNMLAIMQHCCVPTIPQAALYAIH